MTHRFSFGLFVGLLLLCSVFAGCGSQQTSVPKEERVVTDTTGREVHLPGEVKSIAVVPIPWASVVYAVDGSAARIAGMHPSAKAAYEISMLKNSRRRWRTFRAISWGMISPSIWRNSAN